MQKDDISVIREIPLFSKLSDEHFETLFQMAYLQQFPPQLLLMKEGDPADFLHIVMEGTVELFGSSNDRESTMLVLRPFSAYNLSAVLEDAVYMMSVRTLDQTRILMIPATNIRELMSIDPGFAHAMVTELAKRYRTVIRAFKEQRLRSGIERVANYLLRANEQATKRGQIELTEDKRTLAALLGMTPEYLSRAFTSLREYGVEVNGNKILLKNLAALNRLAQPNPLIDRREV
jgi:CRP/FNR family transcriptional activator FtrB